jgi:hypothetical protein
MRSPLAVDLVNSPVKAELVASTGTVQVEWLSVYRPVWDSWPTPLKTEYRALVRAGSSEHQGADQEQREIAHHWAFSVVVEPDWGYLHRVLMRLS